MQQLNLFSAFLFPAGSWARPADDSEQAIVIWIANPDLARQTGLAAQLRTAGQVRDTMGYAGGVAVCLRCPAGVRLAILAALPLPPSHGSRTPGVELPW